MHPRWLAFFGAGVTLTTAGCFPPMVLIPLTTVFVSNGATPRSSDEIAAATAGRATGKTPPPASQAPTVLPVASGAPGSGDAAYFPARPGTWRYRVSTAKAGGTPIVGERAFTVSDVVVGETTTAVVTTTVKLGVPGFTTFDEDAVRREVVLSPIGYEERGVDGRSTLIRLPLQLGQTWGDRGLTGRAASLTDGLQVPTLGPGTFTNVWRLTYALPATPDKALTIVWLARGVGPVQRVDTFAHDGVVWESGAELVSYPAE